MTQSPPVAGRPRSPWRRWLDFWFAPADPAPLGFMRVVTGLIVLYVHLAYAFDLNAFFGRNAWYGLAEMDRERHEFPWLVTPIDSWQDSIRTARVPDYPHRRRSVMEYLRAIPADPDVQRRHTAYLRELHRLARGDSLAVQQGIVYIQRLTVNDRPIAPGGSTPLDNQLRAFVDESVRGKNDYIPDFLRLRSKEEREKLALYARDFLEYLPKPPRDRELSIPEFDRVMEARQHVLDHYGEMDPQGREAFLSFVDDLPADPAARGQWLDYLDHWNNEARAAHRVGHHIFSLWFHVSDPTGMAVAHGCILVIFFLFTVGLWTRVTSVLTWLAAMSYIHRSQQVLFGMDTMMNILLLYLTVGNSGAAFSVDRLIARYRATRASLSRTGGVDARTRAFLEQPPPSVSAGFALRLTQVHFCFIYMAAGMSKLKGAAWWNHNAFWDTVANPEFTMIHYQWYEGLMKFIASNRWMYATACAGGVFFTLFMELSLAFLVWTRLRPYIVIGGLFLHLGIAVFMGLNMFGLLMMTLLLAYIPGAAIRSQLGYGNGSPKLTYRFNPRDQRHLRAAARVKAADVDNQIELAEAAGPVRVTAGGKELSADATAGTLFGSLSTLRKVGWLRRLPVVGGLLTNAFVPAEDAAARPGGAVREPVGAAAK